MREGACKSNIHCVRSTESDIETSHLALPVRTPVLDHVDVAIPDDHHRVEGPRVHARNRF